jgi:hypothetical protein
MPHTVVSLVPFDVERYFPDVQPGVYNIPAVKQLGDMNLLVVKDARGFISHGKKTVMVPVPSEQLANSIVNDYSRAQLGWAVDSAPAMFVVEGMPTFNEIQKTHAKKIQECLAMQMRWFNKLYQLAEDDWQRNPRLTSITKTQRFAAKALGKKPVWLIETTDAVLRPCPFCTVDMKSDALVCPHCHNVVDPIGFKKRQEELAKVS